MVNVARIVRRLCTVGGHPELGATATELKGIDE